jgi:hypothetical protein
MERPTRIPPPWEDPGWQSGVEAWVAERLSEHGLRQSGPMEPRARPWSIVINVPTSGGPCWFKTTAPNMADDAQLTAFLADLGSPLILRPLAMDIARHWMLLPNGGERLREAMSADEVVPHWERILPAYAELQRAAEGRERELLEHGAFDRRPLQLPGLLAEVLDDPFLLRVGQPDGLTQEQLRLLQSRMLSVKEASAELAAAGIGPSIQHDDLHDGNVVLATDGYRVLDWGDAGIGHPFATLLVTLRSVANALVLADWSPFGPFVPELTRVRDAYLEPWTDRLPRRELERLASLAMWTGMVARVMAWRQAFYHANDEQLAEWGGAIPEWLTELASVTPA